KDIERTKVLSIPIQLEAPETSEYDKKVLENNERQIANYQAQLMEFQASAEGIINSTIHNLAGVISGDLGFGQFFGSILDQFGDFLIEMAGLGKIYAMFVEVLKKTFVNPGATLIASIGMLSAGVAIKSLANN